MTTEGRFAAAITCMDGRIQTRVIDQVMTRFGVRHVDDITAAGVVQHLDGAVDEIGEFLLENLAISTKAHGTTQVAIVAHAGCAGNPVPDNTQKDQLRKALATVRERFPDIEAMGLFYNPKVGFERVN